MTLGEIEELQNVKESSIQDQFNQREDSAKMQTPLKESPKPQVVQKDLFSVEKIENVDSPSSNSKQIEFDVAPLQGGSNYFTRKQNTLLSNVQDQIIDEEEEGASKSSRRESIYIGETDSIDMNPNDNGFGIESSPDLGPMMAWNQHAGGEGQMKGYGMGKSDFRMPDALNAFEKKPDPFASRSEQSDLAELLRRNEEMMKLISADLGGFDDIPEPQPIPSIKKSGRGMKNSLSEKYKLGKLNLSKENDGSLTDEGMPNLSDVNTLDDVRYG